jgi:citrate lyase subunit beta / citryl-CoA lyase
MAGAFSFQGSTAMHPAQALFDPEAAPSAELPVCDHYAGIEVRMLKSLQLQAELGPVFDVTLDIEDGAPVGGEIDQAQLVGAMLAHADNRHGRVGLRLLPVSNPLFERVLRTAVAAAQGSGATHAPAYLMCPKPRNQDEVVQAAGVVDAVLAGTPWAGVPLHVLVETHGALRDAFAIAAHPRVQSLSFGLMDFVSGHRGAIPESAMQLPGQFEHPLVVRAKLDIAAACHAAGKTPSHCVVTAFNDEAVVLAAAQRAHQQLGYTRMWSIHPSQIRPIVQAFTPPADQVNQAMDIIAAAQAADWAPIRVGNTLHDRASYRYFWQVLQRAHRTAFAGGAPFPTAARQAWFS